MLYRKVDELLPKHNLNVSNIFYSMLPDEKGLDFNAIRELHGNRVPRMSVGDKINDKDKEKVLLVEDEEKGIIHSVIEPNQYALIGPHITSCAAVIFYLRYEGYTDQVVHAYHAYDGVLDEKVLNEILEAKTADYVIYASREITEEHQSELEKLTQDSRIGIDKVCMVDGFETCVLADSEGNLRFY